MTDREKIEELLHYYRMNGKEFAEKCNIKQQAIADIKSRNVISKKISALILAACPEISKEWLQDGEGKMLRDVNIGHTTNGDNSPISGDIEIFNCKSEIELANTKISYLEQIIKDKEELIELLKKNQK